MTTVIRAGSTEAGDAHRAGTYVYIGRPSKWGNPFAIGSRHAGHQITRAYAITLFRQYWEAPEQEPLRAAALVELRDKVLGCYCSPRPCHGDVIADFVNAHARTES